MPIRFFTNRTFLYWKVSVPWYTKKTRLRIRRDLTSATERSGRRHSTMSASIRSTYSETWDGISAARWRAKVRLYPKSRNGSWTILPGTRCSSKKARMTSMVSSVLPVSQMQ